jgi:16S rRNA (guanine527-N7)-methyltransferase
MFHVKHEGSHIDDVGVDLTPEQTTLLRRYEDLLAARAVPRGLVAASDIPRIWARHVLDGLRGAVLIPPDALLAYDVGSGAGLPGIPIAIACPRLTVVLAEARRGRSAFLELVVDDLALSNVRVYAGRAENLAPGADVAFARAFRSLADCWQVIEPLLAPHGRLLYWAGHDSAVGIEGVVSRAFFNPALADAGPIVMMARQ